MSKSACAAFAIALSGLIAAPAMADDFRVVDFSPDMMTVMNLTSIQPSGEVAVMQVLKQGHDSIDYVRVRMRFDCGAKTVQLLHATAFDLSGKETGGKDYAEPATPVKADSDQAEELDWVCKPVVREADDVLGRSETDEANIVRIALVRLSETK